MSEFIFLVLGLTHGFVIALLLIKVEVKYLNKKLDDNHKAEIENSLQELENLRKMKKEV